MAARSLGMVYCIARKLLGICFLRCVPEDVVGEIGVPVEALAKTGEEIIKGVAGERGSGIELR